MLSERDVSAHFHPGIRVCGACGAMERQNERQYGVLCWGRVQRAGKGVANVWTTVQEKAGRARTAWPAHVRTSSL